MSEEYHPATIEASWQQRWAAEGRGRVDLDHAARPFYNLMEFPYPSGEGLHIGHVFSFGGADSYGRYLRRRGFDVFQPIGFDAFGIHSENYALKVGAHPRDLTPHSIAQFRAQLQRLGAAFDWSREVDTTDPAYYRWTQWIFLKLYEAGLAYRAEADVNWCPACLTVLANEQVIAGRCERCDTPMTRRRMAQWFFRITAYAERLLDFSQVDFSPAVIRRQQAWIGRSEGADIEFRIVGANNYSPLRPPVISVFSTRPETLPLATFVALAPEHPLVASIAAGASEEAAAVRRYVTAAAGRLELERQQREPDGVFTGWYAIAPTGARLPIWVADYVLAGYGAGAIMGVPTADERDQRFAAPYGLVANDECGTMSDESHSSSDPQRSSFSVHPSVHYRLRDWLISRQRYWGPPIPIIYCDDCGVVPVPEEQLPVLLPPLREFRPTGAGIAPLATVASFVDVACPRCGAPARRETDVSDNFLDSAWYFLRYCSTERDDRPWDAARVARWLPVGMYTGGPEHATMHHLYARFISMALHDLGLSPVAEPFARLRLHGTIIRDGRKMSKSRGNAIAPDEYLARYGADATRMALLFLGPFEDDADIAGFDQRVAGMLRFLRRVWDVCLVPPIVERAASAESVVDEAVQTAIRRVTDGLEARRFHTAIAALMELTGQLRAASAPAADVVAAQRMLVLLLAPFAPHITEELWQRLGGSGAVHEQPWPQAEAIAVALVELPVQVDGRLRGHVSIPADADEAAVRHAALTHPAVQQAIGEREIRRVVVIPGRVANVVTRMRGE